jgi:membrane fusion protein (multidrug efflux system)
MKKYLILSILILLFTSLASCGEKKKEVEQIIVKKEVVTRVEAMTLKKKAFESFASYPGVFQPWDSFTISSEFGGIIEYMPYEISDFIKKGDTVVRINTSTLRAQINQAKVAQDIAKVNLERVKKLYDKNLTTKANLDNVTFQKNNADAQMNILNVNLNKSVIKSPFNGYVLRKMKQKGELSGMGMPIVSLIQLDKVKFILPIPERDLFKVSKGNIIMLELEANSQKFKGVVYRIAQESNPSSHTVNVEVEVKNVKNEDGEFILKPGMLAKAYVPITRARDGFVVSLDSILKTEKGSVVFIGNNGVAKRVNVEIVSTNKDKALIKSKDLKEGDSLITKGFFELTNKSKLNIVKLDKNEYKENFKIFMFKCENNKKDKSSDLDNIRKILDFEKIEIIDLYRDKNNFNLIYRGELPEFLSKCEFKL